MYEVQNDILAKHTTTAGSYIGSQAMFPAPPDLIVVRLSR